MFTKQQKDKIRIFLHEKPSECAMCGKRHFYALDVPFKIEANRGELAIIIVMCKNCGHLNMFDADVVGVNVLD